MSKGRIEVKVGQAASDPRSTRFTTVKFPFTEEEPSLGPADSPRRQQCKTILDRCQGILESLTPHERDVVLIRLVTHYGNVVR